MNASTERQQKPGKVNEQSSSKKRSASTEISSNAQPHHTSQKRRTIAPNAVGVFDSKTVYTSIPAISLANDEHLNSSDSSISAHPLIVQRVQELVAQVGFDQLRKILDGLASSTSPSKSNEDWNLGSTTIKHENIHQHIKDMMNANGFSQYVIDGATSLTSSSNPPLGYFDSSLIGQLKILLTIHYTDEQITQQCLDAFNRQRKIGNDAIKNAGFQLNAGPPITMKMEQTLLAIYNYATNNSYEIATEEQRIMGDLTTYKESTIYRIIFLLKAVADKYGKDKTVQQLMSSIRPFDLVPIACTGVAWTNKKYPNENVS